MFSRDEADITIISCVIEAGSVGKAVIQIFIDDQTCMGHLSIRCVGRSCSVRCRWSCVKGL